MSACGCTWANEVRRIGTAYVWLKMVCAPLWRKSRQEAEVLSDWCRLMMYGGNADPDLFERFSPPTRSRG
jgi:hypothetical protein